MMYMNELEIIIPAYNAHSTIIKTLDSIKIQKDLPKYHITIVNDFSTNYVDIINNYKQYLNIDETITNPVPKSGCNIIKPNPINITIKSGIIVL